MSFGLQLYQFDNLSFHHAFITESDFGFSLAFSIDSDETRYTFLMTQRNDIRTFKTIDTAFKVALDIFSKNHIVIPDIKLRSYRFL